MKKQKVLNNFPLHIRYLLETSETFCLGPESEPIFYRSRRQPRFFSDEKADYFQTALATLSGSPLV